MNNRKIRNSWRRLGVLLALVTVVGCVAPEQESERYQYFYVPESRYNPMIVAIERATGVMWSFALTGESKPWSVLQDNPLPAQFTR